MCCKMAKHKVLYSVVQCQGFVPASLVFGPAAALPMHSEQLSQPTDSTCFHGFCCVPSIDTSFMYMIAGLCMLKLYQTRHPDINASAYSAYASFAVVICLAVLGVVWLPLTYLLLWKGDGVAGNIAEVGK